MKQRTLTFSLMIVLTTVMCGCGSTDNSTNASTSTVAQNQNAVVMQDSNSVPSMTASEAVSSSIDEESDNLSSWDDVYVNNDPELPTSVDFSSIDGIIMVQYSQEVLAPFVVNWHYDLCRIDPLTGEVEPFTTFTVETIGQGAHTDTRYTSSGVAINNRNGYDRRLFSPDYTKIAVTKVFNNQGGEMHAGWMDHDGNFFDVTEALGEASSGFDDPVKYGAVGFTEDGYFVYTDDYDNYLSMRKEVNFYYTELDNISECDGNPLADSLMYEGSTVRYFVTDWLDDTHCLASTTAHRESFIYDVVSGTKTEYIPSGTHANWSGVISPDGDKIAFLSYIKGSDNWFKSTKIYITALDNDASPIELSGNLFVNNRSNIATWSLLEWR